MWRVALAGIVAAGIVGCASDHVRVHSCDEVYAAGYAAWSAYPPLTCGGFSECNGWPQCTCVNGTLQCAIGPICDDSGPPADSATRDAPTNDASHDAGLDAGPCAPHPPPSGTGCHTSGDCNSSNFEMCYAPGTGPGCPICVAPTRECASDTDCPSTAYCEQYVNPCTPRSGFCNPSGDPTSTRCTPRCTATSCGDGFMCLSTGRCSPITCLQGYTCPVHMRCGDIAGGDVHGCFRDSCSFDADCGCGGACLMGYCYDTLGSCIAPAP